MVVHFGLSVRGLKKSAGHCYDLAPVGRGDTLSLR
jgi:hypothetical protein